jgi:hypothetical protein
MVVAVGGGHWQRRAKREAASALPVRVGEDKSAHSSGEVHRLTRRPARGFLGGALRCLADSESPSPIFFNFLARTTKANENTASEANENAASKTNQQRKRGFRDQPATQMRLPMPTQMRPPRPARLYPRECGSHFRGGGPQQFFSSITSSAMSSSSTSSTSTATSRAKKG